MVHITVPGGLDFWVALVKAKNEKLKNYLSNSNENAVKLIKLNQFLLFFFGCTILLFKLFSQADNDILNVYNI